MTRKQIVVCTILAFLCSPPFPDPLFDMMFRFPTPGVVCLALILLGRTTLLQESKRGIQRLVAGLMTATIVLLAYVIQLGIIISAMAK